MGISPWIIYKQMEQYQMDDDIFDEIDSSNVYSDVEPEEIDKKIVIGSYIRGDMLKYASGIDGNSFLKFKIEDVHQYLLENCIFRVRRNSFTPLRIIKVLVSSTTGDYNVVDKTYWIRLIQRCWKSRLVQYKSDLITLRKRFLYQREINGHYPRIKGKKIMGLLDFRNHSNFSIS